MTLKQRMSMWYRLNGGYAKDFVARIWRAPGGVPERLDAIIMATHERGLQPLGRRSEVDPDRETVGAVF